MKNQGLIPSKRRAQLRWLAINAASFVTTTVAGVIITHGAEWIALALWHLLRGLL
jgi:hypothetical protein